MVHFTFVFTIVFDDFFRVLLFAMYSELAEMEKRQLDSLLLPDTIGYWCPTCGEFAKTRMPHLLENSICNVFGRIMVERQLVNFEF